MKRAIATVAGLAALALSACGSSSEGPVMDSATIEYQCNDTWGPSGKVSNPSDDELEATVSWWPTWADGTTEQRTIEIVVPPRTTVAVTDNEFGYAALRAREWRPIVGCGDVSLSTIRP
jgi:hypothetical protein